jgi:hypothetical protein
MGRKKQAADVARTARIYVKVRPEFLAYSQVVANICDEDLSAMVARLIAEEGARRIPKVKPPPR